VFSAQKVPHCRCHPSPVLVVYGVGFEGPGQTATIWELGYYVEVYVEYTLEGIWTIVLQDVELRGAADFEDSAGDAGEDPSYGLRRLFRESVQSLRCLLGDNKSVSGAEWVDIEEGEYVLVLVHLVTGHLAVDD